MNKQTAMQKMFHDINEARKMKYWGDSYILDWLLDKETQDRFINIEREQIVEAHEQGMIHSMVTPFIQECDFEPDSEHYYNETYGGQDGK